MIENEEFEIRRSGILVTIRKGTLFAEPMAPHIAFLPPAADFRPGDLLVRTATQQEFLARSVDSDWKSKNPIVKVFYATE